LNFFILFLFFHHTLASAGGEVRRMQMHDSTGAASRGSVTVRGPRDSHAAPQTRANQNHALACTVVTGERGVAWFDGLCLVDHSWLCGRLQISNLSISFHPEAPDAGTLVAKLPEPAAVVVPLGAVLSMHTMVAATQQSEREKQRDKCVNAPGIVVACIDWYE